VLASAVDRSQIARVITPAPPYALAAPNFRFRALASLAGRAPLGGQREVALAVFLLARLVDDARGGLALNGARRERADAARSWLAALALPATTRVPLTRLADATAAEPEAMRRALAVVTEVTLDHLDAPSRAELQALLDSIRP
jgi:hypothetical protein